MPGLRLSAVALTMLVLCVMSLLQPIGVLAASEAEGHPIDPLTLAKSVDVRNVLEHARALASLGSRLTGYEGYHKAREYIVKTLEQYGINVSFHRYRVLVPFDEGSRLVVMSEDGTIVGDFAAYALWPNGVNPSRTPREGISGRLVYVGKGELSDFDGKEVENAIVLMDYDSYDNWLNAAKLGASTVIFIEPEDVPSYHENLRKFTDTPLSFPRLYVPRAVGERLKELLLINRVLTARVFVNIGWREVEAENVIGVLPGKDPVDTLLLTTHFDSWSPVPALAASAHEALSAAYLLELARVLSGAPTKPQRTVWLVFFSGYWQALAGPREFVERYYFGPELAEGRFRPLMLINIGFLDPEGVGVQVLRGGHGTFYGTTGNMGGIALRYAWVLRRITDLLNDPALRDEIIGATGIEPRLYVRDFFTNAMYWGTEAYPYMLASEPAEMTGGVAFTLQSMYASKPWLGTPVSDLPLLERNVYRLRPQLLTITYLVASFIYERELGIRWSEVAPSRVRIVGPSAYFSGFITLRGKVLAYNLSIGWYRAVPNAIVRVYVGSLTAGGYYSPPFPFNKIVTIADENGEFEVRGLAPYPLLPGVGAVGGGLARSMYVVEAWKVDDETGRVTYAPDFGLYGAKAVVPAISPLSPIEEVSVVVSRFHTITLFDLFNPKEGRPPVIPDPRTLSYGDTFTAFYAMGGGIQVFDFNTKGEPLFYGAYFNGYEPVGLAFFQPGSVATVLFRVGGIAQPVAVRPVAVVVNASTEFPEGAGVSRDGVTCDAFDYARDLLLITRSRYEGLVSRGVRSLSVEEKLSMAEQLFDSASKMLSERRYSAAYSQVVAAWAIAQRAYEETMALIDDSSRTGLFFFALIIPAAVFMERLVLHREGKSRILSTVLVGGFLVAFFAASHPALHVMTNSFMALLGMVAILLFLITVSVLADETKQALRELSYRLLGMHEIETRRVAVTSSAFTVSLENMRKRKLRTLLTMLTFLSITIAVTSLTSVSPFETVKEVPLRSEPTYVGLLVKSGFGVPPRDAYHPMLARIVEGIVGSAAEGVEVRLRPRVWYYPTSVGPAIGVTALVSTEWGFARNYTYRVIAAMGMTPEDVREVLGPYLTPGSRAFLEHERFACIIPDTMARHLNVSIGDTLVFQGLRLLVVGIYNASLLEAQSPEELDGYSLAPIDPHYVSPLGLGVLVPAQQVPPPLAWSTVIIVPYKLGAELGGYVSMISVSFPAANLDVLARASRLLSLSLDVPVIVSDGSRVSALSRYYSFVAVGWEMIPIVLVIGVLNAMVTLLGNFKERLREMFVYASLGLTPLGASVMYMIESLTYASLSITLGYFVGFVLNNLMISAGFLPAYFTFNYASIFIVISLAVLILTAFASSLYVAANAATIITPSLERRWKPPTKPRKGVWEVPLPISLPSHEEALGLVEFLREYYEGLGAERAAFSIRSLEVDFNQLTLRSRVALAPYELGITQTVEISAFQIERERRYQILAKISHETGSEQMWEKLSYYFLDDLRKQLLLWRSLSVEEHRKYAERARKAQENSHSALQV